LSAADKIIVLSSEGRVVEQGNFQELNANQGYVTSLNLGEPFQGLSKIDEIDAPTSIDFKLGATSNKEGELDGYAAVNRRTGDSRIYLYYVTSLGYVNTVFLLFFLSGFIFCVVFPSKSNLSFLLGVQPWLI
jgi:ATP-binding cassette subfamily C (CFTR/MRP) protein 1